MVAAAAAFINRGGVPRQDIAELMGKGASNSRKLRRRRRWCRSFSGCIAIGEHLNSGYNNLCECDCNKKSKIYIYKQEDIVKKDASKMPKAPKLSQQELDDEFEQFLKESFSDDSTDFTSKRNRSPRRGKKEDTGTPWWMKGDDDSSLKSGRAKKKNDEEQSTTPSSMKWLKPKKQSTPLREVQEEEDEEVLKPKSILQKGKRVEEEEEEPKKTTAVPRRQIRRDSLEEDNLDEKFEESHKRSGVMPEQASFEDTYSQSEPTDGLTTAESTGQDPYGGQSTMGSTGQDPYGGQSTFGSTGPGAETLEEIADKAKFFKELEEKAERTVDYSRLNRDADLSGTMGTMGTMGTLPSAYMGPGYSGHRYSMLTHSAPTAPPTAALSCRGNTLWTQGKGGCTPYRLALASSSPPGNPRRPPCSRPPVLPGTSNTTFNGMDVDRGVDVARRLRETCLV
eukprot:XP_011669112.1 PREDICTED: centrosomal protein of 162 kDa [Strongylocentrotus purpuratus]